MSNPENIRASRSPKVKKNALQTHSGPTGDQLEALKARWLKEWPQAMSTWSRFTKLREPIWCENETQENEHGLSGSLAMIRLSDHLVIIGLRQIFQMRLEAFGLEILAHEIGHHVVCPANLTDHGKLIAFTRRGLPKLEHLAPMVANLYSDLLINHHLQKQVGLNMAGVYELMGSDSKSKVWNLYLRIYEILWCLPKKRLVPNDLPVEMEGDAYLGARLIRVFARNWLEGSGRFACLLFPYLYEDNGASATENQDAWADTKNTSSGEEVPGGLVEIGEGEGAIPIHPSLDPLLNEVGSEDENGDEQGATRNGVGNADAASPRGGAKGQCREPFEYGEILKALGIRLTAVDAAIRYYKEMAVPYLIPFPSKQVPKVADPLPEGLETWDIGSSLEEIDWQGSTMLSPVVIPGVTTMQRVMGTSDGDLADKIPLDLDLYVDSSGSMPNPQTHLSYLTLAGTIIALSALRAGAKVQATLWSGSHQFIKTSGFVRAECEIMKVLVGFFGGGTAFPIHVLRDTYQERKPTDRKCHIMVISDEGVDTMLEKDEKGTDGKTISDMALRKCGAGGSLVLNLYRAFEKNPSLVSLKKQGWNIYPISDWETLTTFARDFSRAAYSEEVGKSNPRRS